MELLMHSHRKLIIILTATLFLLFAVKSLSADPDRGRMLYQKACASCHGSDGTGAAPHAVGFETPLPDFTDCSFATREPDIDWLAVSHDGGPARGFANMMAAFGEALTLEDLQLIIGHVRSFCPDRAWPRGDLNLPRPLVTEKAFPEDEAVISSTIDLEGDGGFSNELVFEKRFGPRNQLEIAVPFGWKEQVESGDPGLSTDWTGGVGDVAIGWKRAVWHDLSRGSIFSATAEIILPTGDESDGFGKGTAIFEPFVAWGQILPADGFVHVQAGLEIPFESDRADEEAFWRAAIGKSLTEGMFGRVWSPMIEILGGRELVSGAEVQWDAVPQFQVTLNQRQHVMANVGVRFPINNRDGRDAQLMFYLLWDWFDGGFFEGW